MNSSWHIHNSLSLNNFCITFSWLLHCYDMFMTCSWVVHDLFITCSFPVNQSPQNMGSWDPGSLGRFCQVRKVLHKNPSLCRESLNYQKKVPQLLLCKQVMIVSYAKLFRQKFFFLSASISEYLWGYIAYSFEEGQD